MILHIVKDEKFIDGFIDNQNKYCPDIQNKYMAWPNKKGSLTNIKSNNIELITEEAEKQIFTFVKEKKTSKIIFHNLDKRNWALINKLPQQVVIGWIFYGAEIFNRPENIKHFLGEQTKRFLRQRLKSYLSFYIKYLKEYLGNVFYKITGFKITAFQKAIHRINFIAHWIVEDYEYIKTNYSLKNLKFVNFCYSNETLIINNDNPKTNLLIGNSASFTNNHLDIISIIPPHFASKFEKIIFPLSYSGSVRYKEHVKKAAEAKFGDKVLILDRFLNKQEYFQLLSSVKLAIMGHHRSQAGGNIRFFLKNEIDLMLFNNNNIYHYYENKNVNIHSLIALNEDFSFFSSSVLKKNKTMVTQLFEGEKVKEYYESLLR